MLATYRCLHCAHEWSKPPARKVSDGSGSDCPKCGSLYVKWTNYEREFKR